MDTNVISEFSRDEPNANVIHWFRETSAGLLFVSTVTLGESRYGIEDLPSGKRRWRLEQWLDFELPAWLRENALPLTASVADRWARVAAAGKRAGRIMHTHDAMIAATALEHGLTLVTRNTKHFQHLDLALLDPWD